MMHNHVLDGGWKGRGGRGARDHHNDRTGMAMLGFGALLAEPDKAASDPTGERLLRARMMKWALVRGTPRPLRMLVDGDGDGGWGG